MTQAIDVSGVQHVLRADGYEAVVASVGATLRSLTFEGRDLVVPFASDEVRPVYRGTTLAPWPNRVVDGRYAFDGVEHRLALTEPARGHALHGLLAWADFAVLDEGPAHVVLAATIQPQEGYPWRVTVTTAFALDENGLTQTVSASNASAARAPFGTGPHPYLVAGPGVVDDWTLLLPADAVLHVTHDRLAPTHVGRVSDDAERFDFRESRRIGPVEIDHAYTGLSRDTAGVASARLVSDAGTGVSLSWDGRCPWVQIHTADRPGEPGHRAGLAVEPMTCPPDAFNSGADLVVLEPRETVDVASWTIAAV
ncbi:aldose 1-epimerase family protein [Microbacterium betulae]|uniref:Aldose 1-epimerase family protein n=1 Tax=Microbacterium betulae TaxID=2981139 RepID=A0AA97I4C7_9MICO|nr:aldose 1-epimerase family protein [Microbacterium sp. AB]WOF22471.1 aldose 1-epimerase family protein [Microbacterium sp. AB]